MWAYEYKLGRIFVGRGEHDADLLDEITGFCQKNGFAAAEVSAIGAIKTLELSYYDQEKRVYCPVEGLQANAPFEIAALSGNISLKDGAAFAHIHIVAADKNGISFAGHLAPGTKIFAAEIAIRELKGQKLERALDAETGLSLWVK